LLIVEGPNQGKEIPIQKSSFEIGRSPVNSFILQDEQVSRQHARIEQNGNEFVLKDLRSRNGVFVNSNRIENHVLHAGDRIRIGSSVFVFKTDGTKQQIQNNQLVPGNDEPTSIRGLADMESLTGHASFSVLEQAAKLFRSGLPPKGIATQLLDIFFEGFLPDRAQIQWQAEELIMVARSREKGKGCPPFELPEDLKAKAQQGVSSLRLKVKNSFGKEEEKVILIAPLRSLDQGKGWLYADRSKDLLDFPLQEAEKLEALALLAGGILERSDLLNDQRRLTGKISLMEKYLTPEIARMLSSRKVNIEEGALSVEEREVTVLFSDIQGFTSLSERLSAPEIAALLNEYFQRMVEVITVHHGEVNKFIGDAIMALFGAPKSFGTDALNAVSAGLEMIEALKHFWQEIDEKKRFNIRIGINTGVVVAGNIGSERKMEYTVLGDEVNVASRLEGISLPNTVTIGGRTGELVKGLFQLEKLPSVKVKGKSQTIDVFRVIKKNV